MADDTKSNYENALERIQNELSQTSASTRRRIFEKFSLAALGSIPWVGGFISAAVSIKTEARGIKKDALQTQWHEVHFAVIREIYQNPGSTRYDIWSSLHGEIIREDSAEADSTDRAREIVPSNST